MWKSLVRFFTPPSFAGDENKTRVAQYVHWIALAFMGGIIVFIIGSKRGSTTFTLNTFDGTLIVIFFVISAIWGMSKYGRVRGASILLVIILWAAVNGTALFGSGVRDISFIANFVVLLAAGLLVGWQAAVLLSAFTILAGIGLANAEIAGTLPIVYSTVPPLDVIRGISIAFAIFAVFIFLLISGLESAIKRAQAGTKELEASNKELNAARATLEENRNELLVANEQLKQRSERINAIANISKTITLVQELDRLLPSIVTTISQRLDHYHTSIYLLDNQRRFAVLRASSSKGGLQMLKQGYRVNLAEDGIIAYVANRGDARIVLDSDALFPETRSQIALPLKVQEIVTGVLEIHSNKSNAFTDITSLLILADQVAVVIQNALSAEQAQEALRKAEVASQQLTEKTWKEYKETLERRGYRYDGVKPEPLKEAVSPSANGNSLSIPVRLRGQTIGRLKFNPPDSARKWTEDEVAIAEATAERVALALEGARLLEDAQKRAQREAFLSDVSAKLGASFQLDSILRDTVEELGHTFRNTTVSFQLVNPNSIESAGTAQETPASSNGKDLE